MKLLILTQKIDINDDILGFFHCWVEEFAKNCESVIVICLQKGECHLPKNVKVFSLGKEKGRSNIKYLLNFYKYIWRERKNYDTVFVHMNSEYVVLGGLLWKLWRKKIGLWYAHGSTSFFLKIAEKIANIIFTSTPTGFRIKSRKLKIIGQGIDIKKFSPDFIKRDNSIFKIISVGRISPIKNLETLILSASVLKKKMNNLKVQIIGDIVLHSEKAYLLSLKTLVKKENIEKIVEFVGSVPNNKIVPLLQNSDLFVNCSMTGSLDKAILESMACGVITLSCNEAAKEVLLEINDNLFFDCKNPRSLADKIYFFYGLFEDKKDKLRQDSANLIVEKFSLARLIKSIFESYDFKIR